MKYRLLYIIIILHISLNLFADTYPKDPRIDIINYAYKIKLSDATDKIEAEATIEARFLADGVTTLRLDLTNAGTDGKGMVVSKVTSEGKVISKTLFRWV